MVKLAEDRGELQLTDYGISGIPVFQVSRYAAEALDHKKAVFAEIDFMPEYDENEVFNLLKEQRTYLKDRTAADYLGGIFNKKLAGVFLKTAGMKQDVKVASISDRTIAELVMIIKKAAFEVTGTNSYDKAQICMGGVSLKEINPETMESRLVPGLYFAGEILDVDGICGGYNLQWAWSSGHLAAVSAANK